MLFRPTLLALAAFAVSATARQPGDFCCAVTDAITRYHEQARATSFCSSFLSIKTKTTTITKTATSAVSKAGTVTTTRTVTPTSRATFTLTVTVASGTKGTSITLPTTVTAIATRTQTALVTSFATQTTTATSTAVVTSVSTALTFTTATTTTTSTTSQLDTGFQCFKRSNPTKRDVNNVNGLSFVKGVGPKAISSACNCLSLTACTKTVTTTTTIGKTSSYPTTVTATVTAPATSITLTATQSVTIPAGTSISTAFSTLTVPATVSTTVSSISIVASTVTTTVTITSTAQSIVTSLSTVATSTATVTATRSIGSDLKFKLRTSGQSGPNLVAAAGVSSPPYNWFYWRTQTSGATDFRLDEQCQLLETFAGVYAQTKPSDPNPGVVFSGSGVPVTCEIDIDTERVSCSNPAGGDTTFLCDTSFGVNSYQLWWLGEERSPGSRCTEHEMYAAYTL